MEFSSTYFQVVQRRKLNTVPRVPINACASIIMLDAIYILPICMVDRPIPINLRVLLWTIGSTTSSTMNMHKYRS